MLETPPLQVEPDESPRVEELLEEREESIQSAAEIVCTKDPRFKVLARGEKTRVVVAFAKKNKPVYGEAFDIVRVDVEVDWNSQENIEENLSNITLYEIKSTSRELGKDFNGYFFGLTTAELLVAQKLGEQYRFLFVNRKTREYKDMHLKEVFNKAKAIYPQWSIKF